jgi:hypothetical protein
MGMFDQDLAITNDNKFTHGSSLLAIQPALSHQPVKSTLAPN